MSRRRTPGPWRIDLTANVDCGYSRTSPAIVGSNGVVVLISDPSEGEYSEALDLLSDDARMIVCAPELLEFVEEVVRFLPEGLQDKADALLARASRP